MKTLLMPTTRTQSKRTLPLLFLLATVAASAASEFNDFIYTVTPSNTVTIAGYLVDTAPGGTVVVPETIEGLPVTIIDTWAFRHANIITNITLPETLIEIRDKAFYDQDGITSITIPNNVVEIGESAFFACSFLTEAIIGNSVVTIGPSAFLECHKLADITIGNSVSTIENSAFSGCYDLAHITIPNSVSSIGNSAFKSCNGLVSIAIPDSVATIGYGAFSSCQDLESVTIGSGTATIGSGAFSSCFNLTAITVDAANPAFSTLDGALLNKDQTSFIFCPGGKTGSYAIPASVATIDPYAFSSCPYLTAITVDVANSVYSSIDGVLLDKGQTSLITCPKGRMGSYTIPPGIVTIEEYALRSCSGLTDVAVPGSVATIGRYAFYGCSSLTGVYFEGDAPDPGFYGDYMFQYSNNVTVYYLAGTTGWGATYGGRPTALWNSTNSITLADPGITANQFGFSISGADGQEVVVEATTNLADSVWQPLQTNTIGSAPLYFSDSQWTNYPVRHYRVRVP